MHFRLCIAVRRQSTEYMCVLQESHFRENLHSRLTLRGGMPVIYGKDCGHSEELMISLLTAPRLCTFCGRKKVILLLDKTPMEHKLLMISTCLGLFPKRKNLLGNVLFNCPI